MLGSNSWLAGGVYIVMTVLIACCSEFAGRELDHTLGCQLFVKCPWDPKALASWPQGCLCKGWKKCLVSSARKQRRFADPEYNLQ